MNLIELNAIKNHLKQQLLKLENIKESCMHCNKFNNGNCQQFKARPPEDWIYGTVDCEYWTWDEIPF